MNLDQHKESLAKIKTNLDKLKLSAGDMTEMDKMKMDMMDSMYNALNYVYSNMYEMEEKFHNYATNHGKGHLPAAKTPSQMEHCLDVLGMKDDYVVQRPSIIMSSARGNKVITAKYNKPETK